MRLSTEDEWIEWTDVFSFGEALIPGTADRLGFRDDAEMMEHAEGAWRRLGALQLEHFPDGPCWARDEFGDP